MERLHQPFEFKFAESGADVGTFEGYGAYFDNIDRHKDVVVKGAFADSLAEWKARGRLPAMLLQHGLGFSTSDGLPIGVWKDMAEDSKGLHVRGKLINLDTERGKTVYGAMKEGALDGLSIGYKTLLHTIGQMGERVLKKLKLFEVSVVADPANEMARVEAMKMAEQIKTIREFEDFLRDVGGFSHAAAKAIAIGGFKASEPRDEDGANLAALLRRNIESIST